MQQLNRIGRLALYSQKDGEGGFTGGHNLPRTQ
jgi:hypothetical protein